MRHAKPLAAALAATLLLAATPAGPGFVELFNAAKAAHAAKDYATMQQKLEAALKLRPAHPAALYNLGAALALRGEKKDALEQLETLAEMGLSYDPAADPDFAAVAKWERFADVNKRFARNRRPVGGGKQVFTVGIPTFIPEGFAYDEHRDTYYIGGAHERRIQRVPPGKSQEDFIQPGAGGLWAPLGLFADERRRLLWVASAAIPEMKDAQPGDLGKSAILAYDLDTGAPKKRFVLDDGQPHVFGDVIVLRQGDVYTTDSKAGILYRVDPDTGKFEALTKAGELASPQGLVQVDRWRVYIADYTQGLYRYDLGSKKLRRLDVSRDICVYGIDGLYRWEDTLVAIQNGIRPHRVVQFGLSRDGRRITNAYVVAANLKEFDEPTHGAVVGDYIAYIANSQWHKFDDQHRLPPASELRGPVVLRSRLELRYREREREQRQPNPVAPPDDGLLPSLPVPPLPR